MNEELKIFIKAEIADLKKNLGEAQKEVKETANEGKSGFAKFGEAAKAAGGVVAKGLAAAGAAIVAAGAALLGLAESTKEYRTAQAKLATAFETAGASAGVAKQTYSDLYRVLGDEDKATEAAAHLAQLTTNEQDLAEWTTACQGIYATFGESLPIESLTEAANETAKVGTVTGALADALNWAGFSEEDFNAALAECNDEAEREALIRETLNGLYGDAAANYEKNAAAILAENEAQAKLTEALATLGAVASPIMTTLKTLTADLLTELTPFIALIGEGLQGAFNGTAGAGEKLAEGLNGLIETLLEKINEALPMVIQLVADLFPRLLTTIVQALPSLVNTVVQGATQVLQAIAEMLPELIPLMIDAVLLIVETLIDNIDLIIDAGIALILGLADGLVNALPRLIDKVPVIIEKLINAITNNLPKLMTMGVELNVKLASGLIKAIPQLVAKIPQIITAIVKGITTGSVEIVKAGGDIVKGLWNGIKDMTSWLGNKIKSFCSNALGEIKRFFGIHSPSTIMENQVGKYLAEGIGVGFMNEMADVNKDIENSLAPITAARNFTVHGSFNGLTPLTETSGNIAPINNGGQWYDAAMSARSEDTRPIILKVGEKVLAETTFKAWNRYVDQTGSIPVKVW